MLWSCVCQTNERHPTPSCWNALNGQKNTLHFRQSYSFNICFLKCIWFRIAHMVLPKPVNCFEYLTFYIKWLWQPCFKKYQIKWKTRWKKMWRNFLNILDLCVEGNFFYTQMTSNYVNVSTSIIHNRSWPNPIEEISSKMNISETRVFRTLGYIEHSGISNTRV